MEEGLWSPLFTKHVNDWEMEVVEKNFPLLQTKRIIREVNDKMIWKEAKKKKKGLFSIKSFYTTLKVERAVLLQKNIIWNPWVQSKVSFFGMRSKLRKSFDLRQSLEERAINNE